MESLYQLCVSKAFYYLKSRAEENKDTHPINPFAFLPSNIIDDFLACAVLLHPSVQDLHLLLTCGHVSQFKLETNNLTVKDVVAILSDLSTAARKLHTLIVKTGFLKDERTDPIKRQMVSSAMEQLICVSPLLEVLESSFQFDLKVIATNCKHLKVLKVPFSKHEKIMPDGLEIGTHDLLKSNVPISDCVEVLKHCSKLTKFSNCNISRCLKDMHADEFKNGTLKAQYQLEACHFGSLFMNDSCSEIGVRIATMTCPFIKEVKMEFGENVNAVEALKCFNNLSSLDLYSHNIFGVSFSDHVLELLKVIGKQLTSLRLSVCCGVDFGAIAFHAPLLKNLDVTFDTEFWDFEFSTEYFKHLQCLKISSFNDLCESTGPPLSRHSASMLLCKSTQLTSFSLSQASCVDDKFLTNIFKTNRFSKLVELKLHECNLSRDGVKKIATHMRNLKLFHFSSLVMSYEDAVDIVQSLNSMVKLEVANFEMF